MGAVKQSVKDDIQGWKESANQFGDWVKGSLKPPKVDPVAPPPPPPTDSDAAIRAAVEAAKRRASVGGRASTFLTGARGVGGTAPVTPPRLVGR